MNQSLHNRLFADALDRYEFRIARLDDVDAIVALWPEHWEEAHYRDRGIVPDENRYREWIKVMLVYGGGVWVLALDANRAIGYFNYSLDHNFSEAPVAVMGNFFVEKEHRRSAVPAILFDLGVQAAKNDGACAFHAPIASETLSSRALENTFLKHGFSIIGTMMGRAL